MWTFIGRWKTEMTPLTADKDSFMALMWTHEAGVLHPDWPAPQEIQHALKKRAPVKPTLSFSPRTRLDNQKKRKGVIFAAVLRAYFQGWGERQRMTGWKLCGQTDTDRFIINSTANRGIISDLIHIFSSFKSFCWVRVIHHWIAVNGNSLC